MNIKILSTIILIFILASPVRSINTDQYPPGIKWRYIDSDSFRIVFPAEITEEGQRVANLLEYIYPKIAVDKKIRKRFTLFLPNCGIFSNGYIQLAPQKGEFFSTPPQSDFLGNTEWYSALTLHEGKHIDQYNRLNSGFTRFGSFIFGDLGRSLLSFLSVPIWFFEGEAVNTETLFSSGGRGRLPSFSMSTRAILLADKQYGYIKSYLSSYKDYIPDIYRLGFFLTSYLKNNYGNESIERILKYSSDYSFYPLIFSRAVKKETGMTMLQLYKKVFDDLSCKWKDIDKNLYLTDFKKINSSEKDGWTLYTAPGFLENGDIIAQKFGMGTVLSVIKIDQNGNEENIAGINTIGHINNALSVFRNRLVWAEPVNDLRWGKKSNSEIVTYNISSRKKKRLTKGTRYFSPSFSNDGNFIATIHFSAKRKTSLAILNSNNGTLINEYDSPDNSFLLTPSWSPDGHRIVLVRSKGGKETLSLFNIASKTFMDILPLSKNSYSTPVFFDKFIIYSSPYSGIDNIYAIEISTGKQYMITSSRLGAFFPAISPDNRSLIYSNYDLSGMDIVSSSLDPGKWVPFDEIAVNRMEYFKKNDGSFNNIDLTDVKKIPSKKFKTEKYSPLKKLINFHSMAIIPDRTEPSIEVYSDNKLNTAFLTAGFSYNTNENMGKFYTEAVYAGLFPVLKVGLVKNGRRMTSPTDLMWNETTANFSILIPLDLSKGVFIRKLELQAEISSTKISGDENNGYKIVPGSINSSSYSIRFSNFKQFSRKDLAPTNGQFLTAKYSHTPWDNYYKGEKIFVHGILFFPGLFRHNSLRIGFSYEHQDPVNYLFSSNTGFSRGYDFKFMENLIFASFNYNFPFSYPDIAIGELFYLKRIKAGIFTDLGKGSDKGNTEFFNSAGFEISGDINLFSIPIDIEAGVRLSYRFLDGTFRFEPIFLGIGF